MAKGLGKPGKGCGGAVQRERACSADEVLKCPRKWEEGGGLVTSD